MKVTDLRVTGFKSFVDPVQLKIEPGLTGIVGPNGCGKSNILESLRWVMGATSARALRGGEMDDVIFAGTDKRPQRDIAEVILVLDNADGRAPAPFDVAPTLEISRRIRRAAGSTFKINGKEVRARDVQLLFADASTGANSPALVRQNQVSELINAKPENRRRILEEAAGIAGLYTRRHEAELKLRAAATNLERLDDVVLGLNDQISGLRRQAKQAARYRTLAEDIRSLETFLYAKRLTALHNNVAQAQHAKEQAQTALADATLRANSAAKEAQGADTGLLGLREEQAIAEAVLRRLEGQRFGLERDLKAAQDALAAAKSELARIANDQARETNLCDDAIASLTRLNSELVALPADSTDAHAFEAAQLQVSQSLAELSKIEVALNEALSSRATARAERNAQIRACEDAKAQLGRRQGALDQAIASAKRLEASLPQDGALIEAKERTEAIAAQAVAAGERADTTERTSEEAAQNEVTAREAARQSQNALDKRLAQISALEAATRQVSKGNWPKLLDGVVPEAGYERALAAAFGDDLDASAEPAAPIVWRNGSDARLTWTKGTRLLAEHTAQYPPQIAARLFATAIVEQDAFDETLPIPMGGRIVTKAGDMRRWDGFIRHAHAITNSATLLEQRATLGDLRAGVETARALAQTHARDAAAARAHADQCRAQAKAARSAAPQAYGALSQARDQVMRLENAAVQARSQYEQALTQVRALETEIIQARELVDVANAILAELPETDNPQQVPELESKIEIARAAAIEAKSTKANLENAKIARQAVRNRITRDIAEWQKRQAQASGRLKSLETEHHAAQIREQMALAAPEEIERRRQELLSQMPVAGARKAAADDALAALETTIRNSRDQERAAQNALGDAREAAALAHTRFEAETMRRTELQETIKRTIQTAPEDCEKRARDALGNAYDTLTIEASEARLSKHLYDRDALGGVNLRAEEEMGEQETRLAALLADKEDLSAAINKLRHGVDQINAEGRERLNAAFEVVDRHFRALFSTLFDGGVAELRLTQSEDPLGGGLEVYACPPGKKLQSLTLMSGGEQALTASALIFAVFLSNPSPICVLDEVDAPLDDSNVDRYCRLLHEMRELTQTRFIVITHHPITMSRMDRLFGVTMAERGVSQVVSVDLKRAEEMINA